MLGQTALRQVAVLAAYQPVTSPAALAKSMAHAAAVTGVLDDRLTLGQFQALAQRRDSIEGAAELLDGLAAVLRQDEVNAGLAERARRGAEEAQRLLAPPPSRPGRAVLVDQVISGRGRAGARAALEAAIEAARTAIDGAGDDVEVTGSIQVTRRERG
jgi:hypothetical protein